MFAEKVKILIVIILILPVGVLAQKSPLITGTIGLYADFYQMNEASSIPKCILFALDRLKCNPTFSCRDFSLPFLIHISLQKNRVIVPLPDYENLGQDMANPLNMFGIRPKDKWVQLLLGIQTLYHSELSLGDPLVFETGLRLATGKLCFECLGSTSQQVIAEDASGGIICNYGLHKNALRLSTDETYTQSMLNSMVNTRQLYTMPGVKYTIINALSFSLTVTINSLNDDDLNPLNKYTDNLLKS